MKKQESQDYIIRIATEIDLPYIIQIYNEAVAAKFATADTEPWKLDGKKQWFADHTPSAYPVYVALCNTKIVGFISVSAYRPGRKALSTVKEISYYVARSYHRRGIATLLIRYVIEKSTLLRIKNLLAIVLDVNCASISLLEKFQFKTWGHLPNIADFDGVIVGHLYLGLRLTNN